MVGKSPCFGAINTVEDMDEESKESYSDVTPYDSR